MSYQPVFMFDHKGPNARTILESFSVKFRMMPLYSSQPVQAQQMIERFLREQERKLRFGAPPCPVHGVDFVMLGAAATIKLKKFERGKTADEASVEQTIDQRQGIFRCPVPLCARVEELPSIWELEEMKAKRRTCPSCGKPTDCPYYRKVLGDYKCYSCSRKYYQRWQSAQRSAVTSS